MVVLNADDATALWQCSFNKLDIPINCFINNISQCG